MNNRSDKFGLGLIIGAAVGAVAALFMSPGSGEDNRKMAAKKLKELEKWYDKSDVKDQVESIFGEVTDQGTKMYKQAQKEIRAQLDDLKNNWNKSEYSKIVNDTVDNLKDTVKDNKALQKMKDSFMEGWNEKDAMEEVKKEVKKAAKK